MTEAQLLDTGWDAASRLSTWFLDQVGITGEKFGSQSYLDDERRREILVDSERKRMRALGWLQNVAPDGVGQYREGAADFIDNQIGPWVAQNAGTILYNAIASQDWARGDLEVSGLGNPAQALCSIYWYATDVLEMHLSGAVLEAVRLGVMTEKEAKSGLEMANMLYRLIDYLGGQGALVPPQPVNGLGNPAAPAIPVAAYVVAGVIVIAIIVAAFLVVQSNLRYENQRDLCAALVDAAQSPEERARITDLCIEKASEDKDPTMALVNWVGWALAIGVVGYIGVVHVLPRALGAMDDALDREST